MDLVQADHPAPSSEPHPPRAKMHTNTPRAQTNGLAQSPMLAPLRADREYVLMPGIPEIEGDISTLD